MAEVAHKFLVFLGLSSVQILVLGVAAAVVVALLRVRGAAAYGIFGLVLILPLLSPLSFVLPDRAKVEIPLVSISSRSGVGTVVPGIPNPPREPDIDRVVPQPSEAKPSRVSALRTPHSVFGPPPSAFRTPHSALRIPHWKSLLAGSWLVIVVLLSIRLVFGIRSLSRALKTAKIVDDPETLRLLADCAGLIGLRSVPRLAVTNGPAVPIVAGVFRPVIVLPDHLLQPENRDGLRFTLLHELAHLRRRDGWWLPIELIVSTLYFFHPVVRWVMRRIREEREYLCDLHVVGVTRKRALYADFLLNEIWDTGNAGRKVFALPFLCRTPAVSRRVHRILLDRRQNMLGKIRDCGAVLVVMMVLAPVLALSYAHGQTEELDRVVEARAVALAETEGEAETGGREPAPAMTLRRICRGDEFGGGEASPSPDGKFLAYVDWDTLDLAVCELATGDKRHLTNNVTASGDMAWKSRISPDCTRVAYAWWSENQNCYDIHLIGLDGSEPRVLVSDEAIEELDLAGWSPDGKQILALLKRKGGTEQIVSVSVADGSVKVLKSFPDKMLFKHFRDESVSPDGHYIAYSRAQEEGSSECDIYVLDVESNREVPLVDHPADDKMFGWSPDGKWVLFGSDRTGSWDVWIIQVANGKPQGSPELVMKGSGDATPLGFTRDGSFWYYIHQMIYDVYIATIDLDKGVVLSPPTPFSQDIKAEIKIFPAWSHDGQYLAYLQMESGAICIHSLKNGEVRKLTPGLRRLRPYLSWSRDGRSILTGGWDYEGRRGTYQIDVQTGNVTTLLHGERFGRGVLSPDGETIFYKKSDPTSKRYSILRRDLETSQEKELYSDAPVGFIALSPDGKHLAFQTHNSETLASTIKIITSNGGETRDLVKMDEWIGCIEWTPGGRNVLYSTERTLWKVSAQGGVPQKLWESAMEFSHLISVHPDGQRIAFSARGTKGGGGIWVMENFLPTE